MRYDLIIIGAGPAGLSAAYTAKRVGLSYLVLERAEIASTIQNYPLGKLLFSTPNELEFEPDTLKPTGVKPTREEVIDYYLRFAGDEQRLNIHTHEAVQQILPATQSPATQSPTTPQDEPLTVITDLARYQGNAVLVAVGGMGIINRLNVPGETPTRVSYFFREAASFKGKQVVVVGGGNSAAETVLDLAGAEAQVTLLLRRPTLNRADGSAAIKPWVREPLEAAVAAGKVEIIYQAQIIEIFAQTVLIETNGRRRELACDHIFALIGARPDVGLLAAAGAQIGADGRPEYHPETYETTVANLYVVGHLTRELHMKHAVTLPPGIVTRIAERLQTKSR